MATSDIAALILAAGRSTRFSSNQPGTTKLIAEFRGKPLIRHVAEAALGSLARPVITVTGHAGELVQDALAGRSITFVHNKDYASGLASSLRVGIAAVPPSARGAIILLGDMPLVTSDLIDQLIRSFGGSANADAVAPVTAGRRGNPVLLARSLFPAVARLTGDEGARRLLQNRGIHVIETASAGEAAGADIDTPEALETLRKS
jgi:molybdenum cofactor cytidylyltransferase